MNQSDEINGGISRCSTFDFDQSWYDILTEEEKLLIDTHSVSIDFKKGETVCKRGAFASHIFFLEEGLVKVYLEEKSKNLIITLSKKNNYTELPFRRLIRTVYHHNPLVNGEEADWIDVQVLVYWQERGQNKFYQLNTVLTNYTKRY